MSTKATEVLNDLVKINNDRIEGYEKAIKEADTLDIDIKAIFQSMVSESEGYRKQLSTLIKAYGDEVAEGTTVSGKVYRVWMDVKSAMSSNERTSLLASCEYGEDAWRRAYEAALKSEDLAADARTIVQEQYDIQKKSHDLIKKHRDAQLALH